MADGTENVSFETPATERLKDYLKRNRLDAELLTPGVPMPTVPLAAMAIGAAPEQILKTLVFQDRAGEVVLVIASGPSRVRPHRLAAVTGLDRPRLADAETVLAVTGYPAGGVAPVGHTTAIRVILDRRAAELELAFGGGGAEEVLLRIRPSDIIRLTGAEVADLVDDA